MRKNSSVQVNTTVASKESWILVAIATDEETDNPLALCKEQLDEATSELKNLKSKHVVEHRRLFRRACLSLGEPLPEKPTD